MDSVTAQSVKCFYLRCVQAVAEDPAVSRGRQQEEERLLQIVRKGRFEFSSPYWDDISDEAKLALGLL